MSESTKVVAEGRPVSLWPLWLGILGPPAAWAAQLLVAYSPVEMLCDPAASGDEVAGLSLNVFGIVSTVVAAAITILCGLVSDRARRAVRETDAAAERSVFMAWFGILSSIYFFVVIVVGALGPLAIPGCR